MLQKTPPGWNHQQETATLAHWELKERYVVGKRGRFVKFCANSNDMLSKTRLFGTGRPKRTTGIYAPSNAASEIVSRVGRLVVSNLELFSWIQRKTLSYLKGISPLPTHFLVSIFLGFLPLFFACQSLPFQDTAALAVWKVEVKDVEDETHGEVKKNIGILGGSKV